MWKPDVKALMLWKLRCASSKRDAPRTDPGRVFSNRTTSSWTTSGSTAASRKNALSRDCFFDRWQEKKKSYTADSVRIFLRQERGETKRTEKNGRWGRHHKVKLPASTSKPWVSVSKANSSELKRGIRHKIPGKDLIWKDKQHFQNISLFPFPGHVSDNSYKNVHECNRASVNFTAHY